MLVSQLLLAITTTNAFTGLPNAMGGYDETPEIMAAKLKVFTVYCRG